MEEERAEGIVLKTLNYKEKDRICTVFTKEHGVVALLVKGASTPARSSLSTPFCEAEWIYVKGRGDLYRVNDASLIDTHADLRSSFAHLQAAGEMAAVLLHSQFPAKQAPQLYAIFSRFLKQLPTFSNPTTLLTAFYLKLLHHEGVLNWEKQEFFPFKIEEKIWLNLKEIGLCRSFETLKTLRVDKNIYEDIRGFWKEILSR